jgi:hypothetical protein
MKKKPIVLCCGVARYCGLELKKDGSPNNLLLASIWAPCGSQDAIERRLLLTHIIEPDLSAFESWAVKKFRKKWLRLIPTKKHRQIS